MWLGERVCNNSSNGHSAVIWPFSGLLMSWYLHEFNRPVWIKGSQQQVCNHAGNVCVQKNRQVTGTAVSIELYWELKHYLRKRGKNTIPNSKTQMSKLNLSDKKRCFFALLVWPQRKHDIQSATKSTIENIESVVLRKTRPPTSPSDSGSRCTSEMIKTPLTHSGKSLPRSTKQ